MTTDQQVDLGFQMYLNLVEDTMVRGGVKGGLTCEEIGMVQKAYQSAEPANHAVQFVITSRVFKFRQMPCSPTVH